MKFNSYFVGLSLLTVAYGASAQVLFQDDFESYNSIADFNTVWTQSGTTGHTIQTVDGSKVLEFKAETSYVYKEFSSEGVEFTDDNPISLSFSVKSSNLDNSRLRVGLRPAAATTPLIDFGRDSTASSASGGKFTLRQVGAYGTGATEWNTISSGPVAAPDTWYNIEVILSKTKIEFKVDGVLMTADTKTGFTASNTKYKVIRIGPGVSTNNDAYIDNIVLRQTAASVADWNVY